VSPQLVETTYGVKRSAGSGPTVVAAASGGSSARAADEVLDVDDMSALLRSTMESIQVVTSPSVAATNTRGHVQTATIGGSKAVAADALALLSTTPGATPVLPAALSAAAGLHLPAVPPGNVLGRFSAPVRCAAADLQDFMFQQLRVCCAPEVVSVTAASASSMHVVFPSGARLAVKLYSVAEDHHVVAFGRCPAGLAPRRLKAMHTALIAALKQQ
jgi:hypothetical protein